MKGDKTQLRTPQIRPYPLQEKFKILFLGGYVYDVSNSGKGRTSMRIIFFYGNFKRWAPARSMGNTKISILKQSDVKLGKV